MYGVCGDWIVMGMVRAMLRSGSEALVVLGSVGTVMFTSRSVWATSIPTYKAKCLGTIETI